MDTALSFFLDNLPQLIQLVKSELDLPSEVEIKIKTLQNELDFMNEFVETSRKQKPNKEANLVVRKIMEVAQQAESLIDTYFYKLIKHKRKNLFEKAFNKFDHQQELHDVDGLIDNVKRTIDEIHEYKIKYGTGEGVSNEEETKAAAELESMNQRRKKVEEEDVIGFDSYLEHVIKLLKDGDSRSVVSIYGMGGLGKTTLARKIYNDHEVKKHFNIVSWAFVSKEYRPKDVLFTLLRSFKSITEGVASSDSMSLADLKSMVQGRLKEMRYLIVLDDIWETKIWDEIQDCFPSEKNGSKILITSRDKEVASHASQNPNFSNQTPPDLYKLKPLEEADSWKLFCKKVFRKETCPDLILESYGRKIVEKCKGLPLSIVVSAGLLARKRLAKQWSDIADNINWYIIEQDKKNHVEGILKLSYNSLRQELRPCFLYVGLYPVDYEISVRQLIQLWIAEGFIQVKQTTAEVPEPEVVAEQYLDELIDRSLIQVVSKRTDGGVKTCRIHDLLRDLCISVSKDEGFFEIRRDVNTKDKTKPRRLSLQCSTEAYCSSNSCDHSSTRSLFCFRNEDFYFYESTLDWFLNEFKLVRVLDLGPRKSSFFDYKLDNFIYLRYLRVYNLVSERAVSDSIRNLWYLEILDTRGWGVKTLPHGIWKLKRLRHVYLEGPVIIPEPAKGAENKILWDLQTLSTIDLHRKNMILLENERFPKLRKLGLHHSYNDPKASELLQKLKCLTHLDILKIIRPPHLPKSVDIIFPPNITKITLKRVDSSDIQEYMNALAKLCYLRILKLSNRDSSNYLGTSKRDLCFAAGGFQQLQVFELEESMHEKFTLEKDAIPQLQRLIIKKCTELKGLPKELWSLKALAEVKITWPSMEMADMLQNLEQQDKIKFIVYPPLESESTPFDD